MVLVDQVCAFPSDKSPVFLWQCDVVYIKISYQYRSSLHRDAQCTRAARYFPCFADNDLVRLLVKHHGKVIDFVIHKGPVI